MTPERAGRACVPMATTRARPRPGSVGCHRRGGGRARGGHCGDCTRCGPRRCYGAARERAVRVQLLGVRGSTPAPGAGLRPVRRAHVLRGGDRCRCRPPVARARRGHRAQVVDRPARRAGLRRLDRAQPPALGPHAGRAVLRRRRPGRVPGRPVPAGPGRQVRPGPAGAVVRTAVVPDHARRAARAVGVPRPHRRQALDRGLHRDRGRHRSTRAAGPSASASTTSSARWPTCPTTRRPPGSPTS